MAFSACVSFRRRVRQCRVVLCISLFSQLAVSAPMASGQSVPPRPLGPDLPVFRPGGDSPEPTALTLENPNGQVTLRDALALALLQSPELASFAWELRAREARILQAGRPPNLEVEQPAGCARRQGKRKEVHIRLLPSAVQRPDPVQEPLEEVVPRLAARLRAGPPVLPPWPTHLSSPFAICASASGRTVSCTASVSSCGRANSSA